MKSHASKINEFLSGSFPESSGSRLDIRNSTPRVAGELQKLIQLFDDVLLEGYSIDHDSLFLPDHMGSNPTCHYCGASLFLSYFDCATVCFDLETVSPRVDTSMRVCGACYIEGRSCTCRKMTPRRLRDFSSMLQERNSAASVLSRYLVSHSVQVDDLGEISERRGSKTFNPIPTEARDRDFLWPRIAVFQAAKELWKLRDTPDIDRVCVTC